MRTFSTASASRGDILNALKRPTQDLTPIRATVRPIIDAVRKDGDSALRRFTEEFDKVNVKNLRVSREEIQESFSIVDPSVIAAIRKAAEAIQRFHENVSQNGRSIETNPGVVCSRITRPLDSVGLYIPSGLLSTVLMLGIPATIAGVRRIILCSPPGANGKLNGAILAACAIVGIEEVYAIGGAQAIAAMAYGTETVPNVAKIVGPGNVYVTAAKAEVSIDPEGAAIDMLAGPTELLIIADTSADPRIVAADLLSQAEHDASSQVVLLTTSATLLSSVERELNVQLASLPRRAIATQALAKSVLILVKNLQEAVDIANVYAPEHVSIQTDSPEKLLKDIQNAGSVFLGTWSGEVFGDYCAGPNHCLPTAGTAKSQSSVSVDTFCKRMSAQKLSKDGARELSTTASILARAEGLEAHARAADIRRLPQS